MTVLTGPWFSGRVLYQPGGRWPPVPAIAPFGDKAIPVITAHEITVVVSGGDRTICFGGDTLLIPWLRTLPGRSGRFDVALLPVSGRRILPQLNRQIVMDAEQAAELAVLRPQAAVPHHYAFTSGWPGDRLLTKSDSGPGHLVSAARRLAPGSAVQVLQPGQLLTLRTAAEDPAAAGRPGHGRTVHRPGRRRPAWPRRDGPRRRLTEPVQPPAAAAPAAPQAKREQQIRVELFPGAGTERLYTMRLHLRRLGWLHAAAAATIVLGVLCAALPAAAASGGGADTPAVPAVPVLHWQPCTGAGETGFECATAQVPLDYQQPHGQMIQLAVIKHPATDPAERLGSLFFNPGGPGTPGTSDLAVEYSLFPAAVRQRFDIISWDPRGVGNSTAATCFPTLADEAKFFTDLPAGFPVGQAQQATWISLHEQFGKLCEQTNPALLAHVSTAETARDLDLLRQAVGDPVLNYYGVSYGTYLGATYANLFPGKVGAMVLDANVNPVAWTTPQQADGIALSTSIRLKSDVGAAATLGQFLRLCGQAPASGCAFSASTASATPAKYAQLLKDLRAHPVTISIPKFGNTPATPPITFTYAFTVEFVDDILFVVQPVPGLAPGWAYGAFVLQKLWEAYHSASPAHGTAAAAQASSPPPQWAYSIVCADSPNPRDPADYQAEAAFAQARSGALGAYLAWEDEPCAGWQATDADGYFGPWNHPTAHTLLLVATTFDPATPYQDSIIMAHQLARARLLTVDGYGHTSLDNPSNCVYQYEASYFINGTLPPAGTVCRQNQPPFTTSP